MIIFPQIQYSVFCFENYKVLKVLQRHRKPTLISQKTIRPSVGGVKVSIVAFQAIDPGSIPGWRNVFQIFFNRSKCANQKLVRLCCSRCRLPIIHECNPPTAMYRNFCLLRFRPGPVRSLLSNLVHRKFLNNDHIDTMLRLDTRST